MSQTDRSSTNRRQFAKSSSDRGGIHRLQFPRSLSRAGRPPPTRPKACAQSTPAASADATKWGRTDLARRFFLDIGMGDTAIHSDSRDLNTAELGLVRIRFDCADQGPDLATTESVGFLQKACQSSTAVSAKFCLGPILQRRKHTTIRFGDLRTRARRLQAANNPSAGCLANRFERAVRNSIRVSI